VKKLNRIFTAVASTRKGEHEGAVRLYGDLAKITERRELLGLIAVNKGDSLVALGDQLKKKGEIDKAAIRYEEALLSYLRVRRFIRRRKCICRRLARRGARLLGHRGFQTGPGQHQGTKGKLRRDPGIQRSGLRR
jgi:hypothetical protein